jgi:hypothetical protein
VSSSSPAVLTLISYQDQGKQPSVLDRGAWRWPPRVLSEQASAARTQDPPLFACAPSDLEDRPRPSYARTARFRNLAALLGYPTSTRMLGNISSLRELEWHGGYPTWRMGRSTF